MPYIPFFHEMSIHYNTSVARLEERDPAGLSVVTSTEARQRHDNSNLSLRSQ